jgi:hypothetical protein
MIPNPSGIKVLRSVFAMQEERREKKRGKKEEGILGKAEEIKKKE